MPERWQHELRKLKILEPPPGLWDRAVLGPRREPPRRRTWRVIAPIAAAATQVRAATRSVILSTGPACARVSRSSSTRAISVSFVSSAPFSAARRRACRRLSQFRHLVEDDRLALS